MNPTPTPALERFAPDVLDFTGCGEAFHLRHDLHCLMILHNTRAFEGVVFYCARIIEALARSALESCRLKPSNLLINNLNMLYDYHLFPRSTFYWGHALRRLGNKVRHVHRAIAQQDADVGLAFLERWLGWFFCHFSDRDKPLAAVTRDGKPLHWLRQPALAELAAVLEKADATIEARMQTIHQPRHRPVFYQAPALPAVLVEMLLDCGEKDKAGAVLAEGLRQDPQELRLQQLQGLLWSRRGELAKARKHLEKLDQGDHLRDEESAGILAGVYKRLWQEQPENEKWLHKCHRAYVSGWVKSDRWNTYLGINAATTALWLGKEQDAQAIARTIKDVLTDRLGRIEQTRLAKLQVNYWDQVTLAEADLLLGHLDDARRRYQDAFAQFPDQTENHDISRTQAEKILECTCHKSHTATFFQ